MVKNVSFVVGLISPWPGVRGRGWVNSVTCPGFGQLLVVILPCLKCIFTTKEKSKEKTFSEGHTYL